MTIGEEGGRVVKVEGWEGFEWVRAGFSTRRGGVSSAYGGKSLNLGWKEEDADANVEENRRRFLMDICGAKRGGSVPPLVSLRQFHSNMIRVVREGDPALGVAREGGNRGRAVLRGDGVMTDVPGVMLGMLVADCVPVLVADVTRRAVAVFHAGWRGTVARIVERGVGTMRVEYGSRPEDLVAAVGPSIGACCYAVGEEVRGEFESQFGYGAELFREVYDSDPVREKYPLLFLTARAPGHTGIGPQVHLDLWEANRRQLVDAGVGAERITILGECSNCSREATGERRYFSHRGEHGRAGRMMGVIGVVGA